MSKASTSNAEDPLNPKVASSVFDLLLIEMVPMAYRVNAELNARDLAVMTEQSRVHLFGRRAQSNETQATGSIEAGAVADTGAIGQVKTRSTANMPSTTITKLVDRTIPQGSRGITLQSKAQSQTPQSSGTPGDTSQHQKQSTTKPANKAVSTTTTITGILGLGIGHGTNVEAEDEVEREAVMLRLDALGYRVGHGLAEKFSIDLARPSTQLECIKFVCKDLWTRVFGKQIDNLKTNHRGTFVLTDNRFSPVARMSMDRAGGAAGADAGLARVQTFLWFPCGIVRGALAALGMQVEVKAESIDLPVAIFHIRHKNHKP